MAILPIFKLSSEKFLILEVSPQNARGVLLSLDSERNLKLEKLWENFSWPRLSKKFRQRMQKWNIIVAASPSVAMTVLVPAKLDRDKTLAKEPISGAELENLLAQVTAKVFNQCRSEASRVLKIEELNTILVDNRVVDFKIDDHRVLNPIGFRASKIDVVLELTLTTRELFEEWKNFFNVGRRQNFFFTETSRAELSLLEKIKPPPISLLILDPEGSICFTLERAAVKSTIRRALIKWSVLGIISSIKNAWQIDEETALRLYEVCLKKDTSRRVNRYFSNIMKPHLATLSNNLERANIRGSIHVDSSLPLPTAFPRRYHRFTLNDLPASAILEKLGFKLDPGSWSIPPNQVFRRLAPFLEFYYNSDKESPINRWLRRRLHWLGSST